MKRNVVSQIASGLTVLFFSIVVAAAGENVAPTPTTAGQVSASDAEVSAQSLSEFFYQPSADRTVLSASPIYSSFRRTYTDLGFRESRETNSSLLGLSLSKGLTDRMALQFETTYGEVEMKGSNRDYVNKSDGFSDPSLSLSGYHPLQSANRLTYGLQGSLSPKAALLSSRDVVGNRFSGGFSLTPRIGLETDVTKRVIAGTYLHYKIYGESRFEAKDETGFVYSRGSETGGNSAAFGGYSEYLLRSGRMGASAQVFHSEKVVTKQDGAIETSDPFNSLGATAYGIFQASPNFELKPQLAYWTLLSRNVNGLHYESNDRYEVRLTARMTL